MISSVIISSIARKERSNVLVPPIYWIKRTTDSEIPCSTRGHNSANPWQKHAYVDALEFFSPPPFIHIQKSKLFLNPIERKKKKIIHLIWE